MGRRVLVVVNPISGRGRAIRAAERFVAAFRSAGGEADVRATTAAGEGTRRAAAAKGDGFDAVVAAGGDGTVNEILNGLAGTGLPVGILPVGTANLLARDLRIPFDPEGAARVVAGARERAVDVGAARNGEGRERRFLCCAGAGFDAAVVKALAEGRGSALGFRGWLRPIGRVFRHYGFDPIRAAADGGAPVTGVAVTICNTANYGGLFRLVPTADPGDGAFDACLQATPGRRALFRYAWGGWRGTLPRQRDVTVLRGTSFRVEADRPVPVQVDGDPFGTTPLEVRLLPGAARVLVPPEGA